MIIKYQINCDKGTGRSDHTPSYTNVFTYPLLQLVELHKEKENKKRWGFDKVPSLSPLLEAINSNRIWKKERKHTSLKRFKSLQSRVFHPAKLKKGIKFSLRKELEYQHFIPFISFRKRVACRGCSGRSVFFRCQICPCSFFKFPV